MMRLRWPEWTWDNVLNERSFGQVGEGEDAMVWIVRYLGGMPLVIAGSAN